MIELKHITKIFTSGKTQVKAVRDVSLEIRDGEIYGIIGFSGAGKSTLVRCINLLERPTQGTVEVDGEDLTGLTNAQLRRARKKIGMIFQHFNLLPSRTVFENIAYPLKGEKGSGAERAKRVRVLVNWIDLTGGPAGVVGIKAPDLFGFKFDTLFKYYYLIAFFVFIGIMYQKWLMRSRTGRAFMAIRDDDKVAELTGINITTFKIRAFVLSAVYSAVAGVLYAMMIHYVSPDSFTSNDSNMFLWTAIMGGMGTTIGPVIGAIIMNILPEALRFLGDWRMVVYGVILLTVIIRYPGGITPYAKKLIGYAQAKFDGKDR